MSPRSHPRPIHKRVPEPQLLNLDLPLSLPSPVAQLLNPVVQVGPSSSSSSSSSNQPAKQNPPKSSSSPPSSKPVQSSNPSPSSPPSSTGGSPNNGESGGNSNDGGGGATTSSSSNNGNNGGNGNQGSQGNQAGGNSNDQGNNNNNDGNGNNSQSGSSTDGNGASTQSGTTTSSPGNSNSTPQNGNGQSSDDSATTASSPVPGTENGGTTSPQDDNGNNNEGEPLPSNTPILGEISSPNQSGSTNSNSQSGNNNNNNSPSKTSQSQSSTGSKSGSSSSTNDDNPSFGSNNGIPNLSGDPTGSTFSSDLPASTFAVTSKSHDVGGIAAGVTVTLAAVSLIAFIIFFLRRRHQRKKAERRVTWISGFVEGPEPADMVERSSIRSSWGTPIERPSSWRRFSRGDPFAHTTTSESLPPVLPLPVHSPLAIERPGGTLSPELSENPFSDDVEATIQETPQPLQSMSTLPIRFSLISAGSANQDPFDDMHRTVEPAKDNSSSENMKLATEQQQRTITGHGPSQANFPLPPSTPPAASVKSGYGYGYAVGSVSDLHLSQEFLPTPSISFSFPDSPISPTFASTGTASYPRRASVKYNFRASQARSDEIHLERGEEVNVMSVYEDGWAFVQKEKDNERGLAPLHCLDVSD
ncbi:hypothetical protein Clacol_007598 [Clathrus columnatus]|uniref:SH3 domain-containing protein n=1 Tax=Clathrus columnatus TaxID=1419009 RepID=A0AAV5AK75_9AGAM|nr:hypothetical protein Clacol_007598 [Clathrus columnatus]